MNKTMKTVPEHDALIYAMVTLSAVDRTMTDRELKKIGDVVQTLPVFADFDRDRLVAAAEACGAILQADDGLDRVLDIDRHVAARRGSTRPPMRLPSRWPRPTSMSSRRNSASCRCSATGSRSTSWWSPPIERSARVRYRVL